MCDEIEYTSEQSLIHSGVPLGMRDLAWEDGIHVLTGPSGSGKTTTGLRLASLASEVRGLERSARAVAILAPDAETPDDVSPELLSIERYRIKDADRSQQFRKAVKSGADVIYLDSLSTSLELKEVIDAAMEGVLVFCSMTGGVGEEQADMWTWAFDIPGGPTLLGATLLTLNNLLLVPGRSGPYLFTCQERVTDHRYGGSGGNDRQRHRRVLPAKEEPPMSGRELFRLIAEGRARNA